MKFIWLFLFLPFSSLADAGFNIQRGKAPCYAVFTGINKLTGFGFYKISVNDRDRGKLLTDSAYRLKENDTLKIYYKEGRRYWQGPIKIIMLNKSTGQFVDSIILIADGNNLAINFSGFDNTKPKYTITKSKAYYPYSLYASEDIDEAAAKRNKYILLAMSVTGFLILGFMIYKKRNNTVTKTA